VDKRNGLNRADTQGVRSCNVSISRAWCPRELLFPALFPTLSFFQALVVPRAVAVADTAAATWRLLPDRSCSLVDLHGVCFFSCAGVLPLRPPAGAAGLVSAAVPICFCVDARYRLPSEASLSLCAPACSHRTLSCWFTHSRASCSVFLSCCRALDFLMVHRQVNKRSVVREALRFEYFHSTRSPRAMAVAIANACRYVAVLSPAVCVIHNLTDGVDITRRLVAVEQQGVLATRCFPSQRDDLCWLTNPVHTEAVATAAVLAERAGPISFDGSVARIAVVTQSSSCCFGIDAVGVASALAMVRDPALGACVLHGFSSAALAWRWLASDAGRNLLDVIRWPVEDNAALATPARASLCSSRYGSPARLLSARSTAGAAAAPNKAAGAIKEPLAKPRMPDVEIVNSSCASWSGESDGGAFPPEAVRASLLGKRVMAPGGTVALPSTSPSASREVGARTSSVASPERRVATEGPIAELELTGGSPVKRRRLPVVAQEAPSWPRSSRSTSASAPQSQWTASDASDLLDAARHMVTPSARAYFGQRPTLPAADPAGRPQQHGRHGPSTRRLGGRAGLRPASTRCEDDRVNGSLLSPDGVGPIGLLAGAGRWDDVCEQLFARVNSAFISGGPGAGKSTMLRRLQVFLRQRYPEEGDVVVLAPTGTAAKTAGGMTYHSFFGFVRDYNPVRLDPSVEAARLLRTDRFRPIKTRLGRVRAVLLDEVSLVGADKLGIMHELLCQSRSDSARPCLWFAFGDFLQLGPVKGAMAFTAPCWRQLFGDSFLDLPGSFRQSDPGFIRAVRDARAGKCSDAVQALVKECWVDGSKYERMKYKILHLMPHHKGVLAHNRACLQRLTSGTDPAVFSAVDDVEEDPDRDASLPRPVLAAVSETSRRAALVDCVAPAAVPHCVHARVIINNNRRKAMGIFHGSVGFISSYTDDGIPIVRLDNHKLPSGVERESAGVHDAGDDWIEVACPPVKFTARILAYPGALAVRLQVPFVLGWATTIHMSQSLSISRAVLDLADCFEAGMVQTALSRVPSKSGLHIKSFVASRLRADPVALSMYREWRRL